MSLVLNVVVCLGLSSGEAWVVVVLVDHSRWSLGGVGLLDEEETKGRERVLSYWDPNSPAIMEWS